MVIEKIIGNVKDAKFAPLTKDYVHIEWHDARKKIHRLTSDGGRDVAIRLAEGEGLSDGDVLFVDGDTAVVVDILPVDCLVVEPKDLRTMARAAYEIGNRHAPLYFTGDDTAALAVVYDELMEHMIMHLGCPCERRAVKLDARLLIPATAHHHHHGDEGHDHDHHCCHDHHHEHHHECNHRHHHEHDAE